jgi:hypothetical protein
MADKIVFVGSVGPKRLRDMGDGTFAEVVAVGGGGFLSVAPTPVASTASTVVVAGSEIDARAWTSVSYTIAVATHDVTWSVFAANAADYSGEVAVLSPASVVAAATSSYAVALAPFSYYRVKIIDTVGASHGTATVYGIAKVA